MPTTRRFLPFTRRIVVLLALIGSGAPPAVAASFSSTLPPAELTRCGVAALAPAQLASLDSLVARELLSAQQGKVRAFAGDFVSRRSEAERIEAGLDHLNAEETAVLNAAVATAIAAQHQAPTMNFRYQPHDQTTDLAKPARELEVHGVVSLTYGVGGGGSYRRAAVYTEVSDPERNFTIGVGVDTIEGDGFQPDHVGYGRRYWRGW